MSVNVPALPNDTQQGGFLDTQVRLKVQFLFSVHWYGLKNDQETDPAEMHVLLYRLQSSGLDPNSEN